MRGSTLERNRSTALQVGSVSIIYLLHAVMQKTITVRRSSSDPALSGLMPAPYQMAHNNASSNKISVTLYFRASQLVAY